MIDYMEAKGWLRQDEREGLFKLAGGVRDGGIILNIGVEYGASLACLRVGNLDARLIGIDIDCSKVADPILRRQCELIEGDSSKLVDEWFGYEIDLLFIDGDHSYEGVKRDLAWIQYVRPGGYVVFHDCYDYDDPSVIHRLVPGVNQAVEEWAHGPSMFYFLEQEPVGTMRIFRRVA